MTGLGFALVGTLLGSFLCLIPALHVYNIAGLLLIAGLGQGTTLHPDDTAMLFLGMVTGYAILNSLPSIFLSVPDDSTIFVVLPGQKYLLQGRGYEAAVLTGAGGLGAIALLVTLTPVAPEWLSKLRYTLQPHLGWILLAVSLFMLMSEWPKGSDRAKTGWGRWWDAWKGLAAGLVTFFLSGILGLVLGYRNLVPAELAFQSLLPAFIGLFAIPWLLHNLVGQIQIPHQHPSRDLDLKPGLLLRGIAAGSAGGLFAAFFPAVTGGIGGFLAGHATAQRDDRLFLISQGASKTMYYVGAYLFFFMPLFHLRRGGMASMVSTFYSARSLQDYWEAVGCMAICGSLAFFLLLLLARPLAQFTARIDTRVLSLVTLGFLLLMVGGFGGWGGLAVTAVATGIGLIPVVWGSRRMNCMGVLLLPITLNMLGMSAPLARWLGLM